MIEIESEAVIDTANYLTVAAKLYNLLYLSLHS